MLLILSCCPHWTLVDTQIYGNKNTNCSWNTDMNQNTNAKAVPLILSCCPHWTLVDTPICFWRVFGETIIQIYFWMSSHSQNLRLGVSSNWYICLWYLAPMCFVQQNWGFCILFLQCQVAWLWPKIKVHFMRFTQRLKSKSNSLPVWRTQSPLWSRRMPLSPHVSIFVFCVADKA